MQLSESFVSRYRGRQPDWGFNGLGYVVYKRTYARVVEDEGRTEEWWETIQRVINGVQSLGADYTMAEMEQLYDAMFNLKCTFAGRGLWQLGTENNQRLGGDSLVNCWMTEFRDANDFAFVFDELMLGGGLGFSIRRMDIGRLPIIKGKGLVTHEATKDADFVVPDKREGWVSLLRRVMKSYLTTGRPFTYSTILIRGKGELIRTFGGTASGPWSLVEGIDKITAVLDSRVGHRLTTTDVLDIANIIGWMVVAGNVRRSAEIAIGDADDMAYLRAKRWDLGNIPSHRAMSNNTVQVDDIVLVPEEFWAGYLGNGEPYGLFNLNAAQRFARTGDESRPDPSITGINPCGEIPLAHREPCNLAELFMPRIESLDEMKTLAALLYKGQKAIAAMEYLYPETNEIVHKNMRLGLSVSGVMQAVEKIGWLDPTYRHVRELDRVWSAAHGWPESIRITTVKPSGTVSLLAGVTPGVHPGYSQFHIRRVRMASDDAMVRYCQDRGFPTEYARTFDGKEDHNITIVSFPCAFPTGTVLADDVDPLTQLEYVNTLQREWADNAVSCTVYYRKDDLNDIRRFLEKNWDDMKSVSFLLHSDHGFDQAPLEPITQEEYDTLAGSVGAIMPLDANTFTTDFDAECEGGACAIR